MNLSPGADVTEAKWATCSQLPPKWKARFDWFDQVYEQIEASHDGLARVLVAWGRKDVAEEVLNDPELTGHRDPVLHIQPAFQEALMRAASDSAFNVELIDLLFKHGASAEACSLYKLFSCDEDQLEHVQDPFLVLAEMERERKLKHLKLQRDLGGDANAGTPRSGRSSSTSICSSESSQKPSVPLAYHHPIDFGDDSGESPESELQKSYPVVVASPWHHEHVEVLRKFIPHFSEYATKRKPGPDVFDLLLWSICCGAPALSRTLFMHCRSPIRVAFFAQQFSRTLATKGSVGDKSRLLEMQELFEEAAYGVLEGLLHPSTRRNILLNIPEKEDLRAGALALGLRSISSSDREQDGSILDAAMQLQCKEFIAHAYCQSVIDELWCGRSKWCGRIMLRSRPTALWIFAQLCLLPLLSMDVVSPLLDLEANPLYESDGDANDTNANIPKWQVALSLFQVPLIKRVVMLASHICFTICFVILVISKPLCGRIELFHFVFFGWVCTIAAHGLIDRFIMRNLWWVRDAQTWWHRCMARDECTSGTAMEGTFWTTLNVASTLLLFVAAGLRLSLDDTRYPSLMPNVARTPSDWIDQYYGDRLSAEGWQFRDRGNCGWAPQIECLRVVLAVLSCVLCTRCGELFFLAADSMLGTLFLCAVRMFHDNLLYWMPLMLLSATAWGLALTCLTPGLSSVQETLDNPWNRLWRLLADSSDTSELGVSNSTHPWSVSFTTDGAFFAPFWGMFDMWYTPAELVKLEESAMLTPLFVWCYLLVNLVLFVNLLIAMFNESYTEVKNRSKEEMRFKSIQDLYRLITMSPVPPPFNAPVGVTHAATTLVWELYDRVRGAVGVIRSSQTPPRQVDANGRSRENRTSLTRTPSLTSRHSIDDAAQHLANLLQPRSSKRGPSMWARLVGSYTLPPVLCHFPKGEEPISGEVVELELQRALGQYDKKCQFNQGKSEARQQSRFDCLRKAVDERFDTQQAAQVEMQKKVDDGMRRMDEGMKKLEERLECLMTNSMRGAGSGSGGSSGADPQIGSSLISSSPPKRDHRCTTETSQGASSLLASSQAAGAMLNHATITPQKPPLANPLPLSSGQAGGPPPPRQRGVARVPLSSPSGSPARLPTARHPPRSPPKTPERAASIPAGHYHV